MNLLRVGPRGFTRSPAVRHSSASRVLDLIDLESGDPDTREARATPVRRLDVLTALIRRSPRNVQLIRGAREQSLDLRFERDGIAARRVPDNLRVDIEVAMNEHIPHTDDVGPPDFGARAANNVR